MQIEPKDDNKGTQEDTNSKYNSSTWLKGNTIKFGNLTNSKVIPEFISTVKKLVDKFNQTTIKLDFSEVSTVKTSPLVPIAACIDYFKKKGIAFEVIEASSYLTGTEFLTPVTPIDSTRRNYLDKIWVFNNSDDVFNIVKGIISSIRKITSCENGVIQSCEWGLYEIMDNVIQHSEVKRGFIMAQIMKSGQIINFCIVDYGVGIFETMRRTEPYPRNDIDAISLSVREGKKGVNSTGQGNGMWGLYNIVNHNTGHLTIISGKGGIYFNEKTITNYRDIVYLDNKNKGTYVNFHIHLNKETLLTEAIKGYTFPDLYIEDLEDERGNTHYSVSDISSGTGTRESGKEMRNELINIYNITKKPVIVDFKHVGIISSSFADELIGKLIVQYGFFQYQQIFRLINMNPTIQTILHRSIAQRFAEDYKSII